MGGVDGAGSQAPGARRFSTALRGYARDEVDRTLAAAADAREQYLAENAALRERLESARREREDLADTIERALAEQRALLETFETLRREHERLRQEIELADTQLARRRTLQGSLARALLGAERRAAEIRFQARRDAEAILAEARARARDVEADAELARERVLADARAIRGLLEHALDSIDDPRVEQRPAPSLPAAELAIEGETVHED